MLSILLKILLILIGILLFLVLIVLFVPVTYRITGQVDKDQREAAAKIKWLFGIVRLKLVYKDNLAWTLKVLWFDVSGLMKKKKKLSVRKEEDRVQNTESSAPKNEHTLTHEEEPNKKGLSEKINDLINKIKDLWERITYYLSVLQENDTKDLILNGFGVTGKILKSIRPRKLKIEAIIGFDSPDTTGKIYGLLCMLYPFYGNDIHITPDFENKVLEGKLFSHGRVPICVLVWNALRILTDRKLFKVIHKYKNGGECKNGR